MWCYVLLRVKIAENKRGGEMVLWLCDKCGAILYTNPESHGELTNGKYEDCDGEFYRLYRSIGDLVQVYNPKTKHYVLIDKKTGSIIHHMSSYRKYDYVDTYDSKSPTS